MQPPNQYETEYKFYVTHLTVLPRLIAYGYMYAIDSQEKIHEPAGEDNGLDKGSVSSELITVTVLHKSQWMHEASQLN
jgi:hypothetical protein